jgi:hypothetical protein
LGARLAERHRFDGVWASGLGISAAHGVPDDSILTMTEFLESAVVISEACTLPVIADCDTGFGDVEHVRRMAQKYEAGGVAGVCIEDKVFPKHNSLGSGEQALEPTSRFCEKIAAAKEETSDDFVVVARTEALIACKGQDEALRRGQAYQDAGADVLLIHSRAPEPDEVLEFGHNWDRRQRARHWRTEVPADGPRPPSRASTWRARTRHKQARLNDTRRTPTPMLTCKDRTGQHGAVSRGGIPAGLLIGNCQREMGSPQHPRRPW